MATSDPLEKEVIFPLILNLKTKSEDVLKLQTLIDELEDEIVRTYDGKVDLRAFKGSWTKRLTTAAQFLNTPLSDEAASWKRVEKRLETRSTTTTSLEQEAALDDLCSQALNTSSPSSLSSSSSSSSSSSLLKVKLSAADKEAIKKRFSNLDSEKFWILQASIAQAEKEGMQPIPVERKVIDFALSCNYYHPSQSLILDLGDSNWETVFTEDELDELRTAGQPILCQVPKELNQLFKDLAKIKNAADIFQYARQMPLDPLNEPLKVWLSTELQNVARLFLSTGSFTITDLPERDQLYKTFGFFNTIFQGSDIDAKGTETSSEASASAMNSKRRLSSIDAIANRKMGRRADSLFKCGTTELVARK
ncbi:hypothetical protein EC973_004108 [Apophysomyces ossiformis]|uniref:Uncharacterized protein n=1 Tax=Apophysomyces ossiformis TaxID=679940 RepID=A0A8H7EQ46_9FUNG|nr:hypothetical protein EC973_004108 [Apophysomyces ossiformis]